MAEIHPLTPDTVAKRLRQSHRVLIFSHVNPDSDTVGCAFALKGILSAMGKTASCLCDGEVPQRLRFLLRDQETLEEKLPPDADTLLAVDVASPEQLGCYAPMAGDCHLLIDHHATGTPFAPYLLDPKAASAGEVLYRVYRVLRDSGDIPELPDVCALLYAAIAGDSGSFQYSSVTPETLRCAADLLAVIGGETAADITRRLFATRTLGDLKANALVTDLLSLSHEGRLAISLVTADDLRRSGISYPDLSGSVDIPRSLCGVEIGLLVKQVPEEPTHYRVSSRSNGRANVAEVCRTFGGGGHEKAGGCTVVAYSPEEAKDLVIRAFSRALEEL